jgi:hypothetical protein
MMSAWFRKNLGDAMLARETLDKIEGLFLSVYGKTGSPPELAVFIRHESEGRLHCEIKAYFSPSSFILAREVEADPCARPSQDGLSLLVGSADSWLALFPKRDS